jgi:hypothetical protein
MDKNSSDLKFDLAEHKRQINKKIRELEGKNEYF